MSARRPTAWEQMLARWWYRQHRLSRIWQGSAYQPIRKGRR